MEAKKSGLRKLAECYGAMALKGEIPPNGDEGLAIADGHIVKARVQHAGVGTAARAIIAVSLEGDSFLDIHQTRALNEVLAGLIDAQDAFDVARAA